MTLLLYVRKLLMSGTIFLLAFSQNGLTQVTVSDMFASNMVLQQSSNINIWGWANPGDTISVTGSWNNLAVKSITDNGKKWILSLSTPEAKTDGTSYTVIIKGKNTIVLNNVLIGEVWLLSGQSNMALPMEGWEGARVEGSADAIAAANYPNIRLISVGTKSASSPQQNIVKNWTNSSWGSCSPNTIKSFSAVGYFFGKYLYNQMSIPIGLVQSAWGGSSCETWANQASLDFVTDYKNKGPWTSLGSDDNQTATVLYNGMIAPLIPFTFAGVLWYQGETNVGRAQQLTELFPAMIEGWRKDFQRNDLPFYFVQLCPWGGYGGTLPDLWEAQAYAQLLKNTAMVGTLDLGDVSNIHPPKKEPIAYRLALCALEKNYGQTGLVYSGPQYKSMQIEVNKIRLYFESAGTGLKAENNAPSQFEIAGDNQVFYQAQTLIDGQTLLVWNNQVASPKHVRYAWSDTATASLYNLENLPATPFRTNTPAYIQAVKISVLTDSELISEGESCRLDWITLGASEVSLNGEIVSESGSLVLKPVSSSVYNFIATGEKSSVSKSVKVFVIPAGLINWCLNKPGNTSSNSAGSSASLAFDGNSATAWKTQNGNNQWISIDLGEPVPIEAILLNWGDAYGKAYEIQASDDLKTWNTIYTESNGDGTIDFIRTENFSARYIRILGTAMATLNGFELKEFGIYSSKKPIMGALKDKNGNTMRGTPMVLGKSFTESVNFATNTENWKTIQNNGFNTVRVCWVDPYYKDRSWTSWTVNEVLPSLDKCVENATETGMNLIINFHNVGAQRNFDTTYQFTLEKEFWKAVAPRYKDNDLVYYELVNEPTFTMSDYLKPGFKESYLNMYDSVRTAAPNRQILLFSFSTIAPEILQVVENYQDQIDWTQTTVAYHMYNSTTSASVKTLMAYHPVICTEWFYNHKSRLPGNEFIKQVDGFKENAETLEKIGSGWIDWRDWSDVTLNELIDTLITDARTKNYWWAAPLPGIRTTGIVISERKIKLAPGKSKKLLAFPLPALAENQKIEWTSSNDAMASVDSNGLVTSVSSSMAMTVITAKTSDGGFTATCEVSLLSSPAKIAYPDGIPAKIPGNINATYFDQGGEGVGYHDLNPANVGNGIRIDQGVDTEFRLPEGTIGAIVSKEWLEYTIEVLQDGNYDFEILFATVGRYGKFHMEFDRVDKTGQVAVLPTGSYSKFASTKIPGIALKKGVQVMRIFFDYADYNMGTISVTLENPTAIVLPENVGKLNVFPTPTRDQIYISGLSCQEKYSILNLYGQVLLQGNIANNEAIDVKLLNSGSYLIRFENEEYLQTHKFIKY
jgi:sialate O-acetylesterase